MRTLALIALALSLAACNVMAQPYPARPIKLIVPDSAGGAPDQLARLVAEKMSSSLGQHVFVDNRPGAGGVLGADIAAKSAADGYTLLMTSTAIFAILPNVRNDLPYDAVKAFVPVARIATASNVLVVNNSLHATTIGELIRLAKDRPGALNYASAGADTPAHLAGEMLNALAGIDVAHVPYKGAAPALLAVIAGNAQYVITSPIAALPHIAAGRVRALATTGSERSAIFPDLPTIAETVPGYEITQTWGIVAPAHTPPDVVRRLGDEIVQVLSMPDVVERIVSSGGTPSADRGEAFAAYIVKERERVRQVIGKSGIVLRE